MIHPQTVCPGGQGTSRKPLWQCFLKGFNDPHEPKTSTSRKPRNDSGRQVEIIEQNRVRKRFLTRKPERPADSVPPKLAEQKGDKEG